jgi:branched-chain amino acid transport system substrate-binding protein
MEDKHVSRRDFLKIAGVAGATVGLGAGLGGLVAACGGTAASSTTATAQATTTTTAAGPATTAAPTTTVSTGPQAGRDIKLGLVSPSTGPLAFFAKADDWWVDYALKTATPDGIIAGDGMKHMIQIIRKDSQSSTDRASQVAADLILNDKVDMVMASGSPDTANPVAVQCETLGCPSIANFVPWQPFFFGRQQTPDPTASFKWTYAHALGLEQIVANFIAMWDQVSTNKKVGFLFANDADGIAWTDLKQGLPPAVEAAGYTFFLSDLYPVPTDDFTKYISEFKKNGCEICCGTIISPDFTNFWTQSLQQGYNPKVLTVGKALLFPQTLEAMGSNASVNATVEGVWHPTWPFKDSITGATCQQLADDYMLKTGEQWTAPIGQYGKYEWAVDVFKRVKDIESKDAIISQVKTTKLNTCLGPMDFTAPVQMGTRHPVENVYTPPVGGAQWIKGTKYPFEPVMVSNALSPELPTAAKVQLMQYS